MKKIFYYFVISSTLMIFSCNKETTSIASEIIGTYTGDYIYGFNHYANSKADIIEINDNTVKIKVYSPANQFSLYTFDNIEVIKTQFKDTSSIGGYYIDYKLNFKNRQGDNSAGCVYGHTINNNKRLEIVASDSTSYGFYGTK